MTRYVLHTENAGLQTRDARGRLGEVARLFLCGVRRVVGRDHINRSVRERFNERLTVRLSAQRRIHTRAGAVRRNIILGQTEVMPA